MQFVSSLWSAFPSMCRSFSYSCTNNCHSVVLFIVLLGILQKALLYVCILKHLYISFSSNFEFPDLHENLWLILNLYTGRKTRIEFHYSIGGYTIFSAPYIFWWKLGNVSMWTCFWVFCPIPSVYVYGFASAPGSLITVVP